MILVITGSFPPEVCGVGDYTKKLVTSLKGSRFKLYYSDRWSLGSIFYHIREIKRVCKDGIINLQYPTQGYGWSIVPHLLCIYFSLFTRKVFSVTIHEHSQLSLKARIAQLLILASANRVIFTNEYERGYAVKKLPSLKKRSTVIKIQSNILGTDRIKPIVDRSFDLVYFGHIRPNKGIEKFLDDVAPLCSMFRVAVVGQVPSVFEAYYTEVLDRTISLGIEVVLDLDDNEVSSLLNDTKIAYLPFPDGASERRGSLLAAFANGAVVLTTVGRFTIPKLNLSIIDSEKYSIESILKDVKLLSNKQGAGLSFLNEEMPKDWNDIGSKYVKFLE